GGAYALLTRSGGRPATGGIVTEFPHIHGMGADPETADTLWLGTHGMLVKVVGTTQWIRIGQTNYDLMGFNVHPTKPGVLLTSGHPGAGDPRPNPLGVEMSEDGGEHWASLSMAGQADFHAMSVSPADPQVVYAWNVSGAVGFYRSRDGGRQWTHVPTTFRQVFALAASPTNREEVWAGTDAGLFRSRDGGSAWQPVSPNVTGFPVTAIAIHMARPSNVYAYAAAPQFGLIRSNDGGNSWKPLGMFLGSEDAVGYLALDPKNPNLLYFATFSSDLYWSADGGRTRRQLVRGGQVLR
ncbi:MAG: F510_1955 family glycosylhydrolase, partial [bacterium]